ARAARQAKKLKYSNKFESSIATNNIDIEVESESILNQNFNTLNAVIYIPYDLSETESNKSESNESEYNKSGSNKSKSESENLFQELQYSTKLEFKLRQELHSKVDSISQYQLSRAIYMLNNMIYTKGKYQGELISEYYIKNVQENITELFEEELEEANSYLNIEEYQELYISLESGLKRGSNGSLFASAFLRVYTSTELQESQSNIELNYIEILNNNKKDGLSNTWGLLEAFEDLEFKKEFIKYANSPDIMLYNFPLIYNFLERMFNRYDLKVNPNMSMNLQESRLVFAASTQKIQPVTTSKIKEIREKLKDKKISNYRDKNTNQDENTGTEAAKSLLNSLLNKTNSS
ncbi:3211_t:CDS:2, partial [Dentiscutata erythropus]